MIGSSVDKFTTQGKSDQGKDPIEDTKQRYYP